MKFANMAVIYIYTANVNFTDTKMKTLLLIVALYNIV